MGFATAITRRTAIATAVVLLASFATHAAGQDSDHILPRWQKGDVVHYRMIRTRSDPRGVLPNDVATAVVTLTVVSATEQGFVVEWKQGATTGSRLSEQNPPTREMLKVVERVPLMLEVSATGQVTGLANWESLRDESIAAFDRVLAEAQKMGTTPGLVERAGPELKQRFASRDVVTGTLAQDARALLATMAQPKVVAEASLPGHLRNPLGGELFAATVKWTSRQSADNARVAVHWTQTVAPDDFRARMRELIGKMMTALGRPIPDLDSFTGSASGEGAAEIELPSGWPEFIEDTATLVASGGTTRDTRRFQRVRPAEAGATKAPPPPLR